MEALVIVTMNLERIYWVLLISLVSLALGYIPQSALTKIRRSTTFTLRDEISGNGPPCPNADKCSGLYRGKGCNGNGKIQGGIATLPFFGWWPIKVYRPCPAYLQAGYVYEREGQTLDQVLYSEPSMKQRKRMEEVQLKRSEEEKKLKGDQQRRIDELYALNRKNEGKIEEEEFSTFTITQNIKLPEKTEINNELLDEQNKIKGEIKDVTTTPNTPPK